MLLRVNNLDLITVSAFMMLVGFCILSPLELYFGNINEFWFDMGSIFPFMVGIFFLLFLLIIGIGYILKGKTRILFACMLFGAGLALYLQGNFLNGDIGQLNGASVYWSANKISVIINLLIWLACIIMPAIVLYKKRNVGKTLIYVISLMILSMQLSSVVALMVTNHRNESEVHLTTNGQFSVSARNNIIVFVLDTMDAQWLERYVLENNQYLEGLKDFIYFDNTVSGGGPTIYGLPMLLTGKMYNGDTYNQYLEWAYNSTNFYDKLKRKNYDTRIYTEDRFVSDEFFLKYVDNASEISYGITSKPKLLLKLYQLVGYRNFPVILKDKLLIYSGEFENYRNLEQKGVYDYTIDNASFIENFRKDGIRIIDDSGAFRFYHMFGAHGPYTLRSDGTAAETETSLEEQIQGVMGMIMEYIEELKKLNIYDNSTIIITGDHGAIDIYQNPCFLIKERGKTRETIGISHAPISFQNVLPTLSQAIDGINNEEQETIFDIDETDNDIRYQIVDPALLKQYYGGGQWDSSHLFAIKGVARENKIEDLGKVQLTKIAEIYHIGDKVFFAQDEFGCAYLFNGFSFQEADGTWTDSEDAVMKFCLEELPRNDIKINILLADIYNRPQKVKITYNGHCVYDELQNDLDISFVVAKEYIAQGEQELVFDLTTTVPADISESKDSRSLSIKLASMQIVDCKIN